MTAATTGPPAAAAPVPGTASPVPGAGSGSIWLWDVFFAGAAVATAALVWFGDGPLGGRVGGAVLVLGLGAGWLTVGRRLGIAGCPGAAAAGYVAALVLTLVAAVLLVPQASWALFVVVPQAFWLLRLAHAVAVTVVLTPGLPLLASVADGEPLAEAVADYAPQGLFMTAFGLLVGVWIHRVTDESDERARLIAELEASRAQVADLSHRAGAAAERERLAGEIHDTLAQGFTSIVTLLQAAQTEVETDRAAASRHVELAVRAAKENLAEARTLVAASTPSALAAHSLTDAVGRQVARLTEQAGVAADLDTAGTPRRLPVEQEVVLLRAAQELLTNVARHAAAGAATVRLDFTGPGAVALTVTDDGAGFDPDEVRADRFGLAMMRGRVGRLDGTLDVASAPGVGTTVTVVLPTEELP